VVDQVNPNSMNVSKGILQNAPNNAQHRHFEYITDQMDRRK
jgi:hypothetical protein